MPVTTYECLSEFCRDHDLRFPKLRQRSSLGIKISQVFRLKYPHTRLSKVKSQEGTGVFNVGAYPDTFKGPIFVIIDEFFKPPMLDKTTYEKDPVIEKKPRKRIPIKGTKVIYK